jgi:uncharacterized protein (TIGR02145 family)
MASIPMTDCSLQMIEEPDPVRYGTVTDEEGNSYKTVTIGSQIWTAENLMTTKFNDSDPIPYVADGLKWGNCEKPGYCWYDNYADSLRHVYGALYNWYAVNSGKLCPKGWHVPTYSDWERLFQFLGDDFSDKLRETGSRHWISYSEIFFDINNSSATNSSGFTAIPGGMRSEKGNCTDMAYTGYWWTSMELPNSIAYSIQLYIPCVVSTPRTPQGFQVIGKKRGLSVRCMKD